MSQKKLLITGGKWMLAHDFIATQSENYDIVAVDREECDIASLESIMQCLIQYEPDIVLNCAAYTAVDDAEDIGMQLNYEVNTLWVYHLARASEILGIELITISTDYVFDGMKQEWYLPTDVCHPINAYGMAKYLGERLALDVNPRTIIVRTSWLYGGEWWRKENEWRKTNDEKRTFKNFVTTMLRLSESRNELRVVNDQHGIPTSCSFLSEKISEIISHLDSEEEWVENIWHITGQSDFLDLSEMIQRDGSCTWADFARAIFSKYQKTTQVIDCTSSEYPTKARRPEWSVLMGGRNESRISEI